MLSAQQTHCPHVCNSRPFSLLVGAWGDWAQGLCKALKARQKLWLQVTPETTCGRLLDECKEKSATVLGWGMQGRGWGVGWMDTGIHWSVSFAHKAASLWEAWGYKTALVGFGPRFRMKLLKRGVGAMSHLPQQPIPSFWCI